MCDEPISGIEKGAFVGETSQDCWIGQTGIFGSDLMRLCQDAVHKLRLAWIQLRLGRVGLGVVEAG